MKKRSERILDCLGDYLANAPDEELLKAAREEGRNPAETAVRVKSILKRTAKEFKKRELLKNERDCR